MTDLKPLADGTLCPAPVPASVANGSPVQLSIRPEKIALDELVEGGMTVLEGTIVERVYLGTTTHPAGVASRTRAGAARGLSGRFG
jgi:hypothetical protein